MSFGISPEKSEMITSSEQFQQLSLLNSPRNNLSFFKVYTNFSLHKLPTFYQCLLRNVSDFGFMLVLATGYL